MIASVAFRNFKALRSTQLKLEPFNLVIGPNGSGKSSLIESMLKLRGLAKLASPGPRMVPGQVEGPEIEFAFTSPFEALKVRLGCVADFVCDHLEVEPADAPAWASLRDELQGIRAFVLDHAAIAGGSAQSDHQQLAVNGGNLAAVLWRLREQEPAVYEQLKGEMLRAVPEFRSLELSASGGQVTFGLTLAEDGFVPAAELSQGMLYLLGIFTIAFDSTSAYLVCVEEIDRGIHPRRLRDVRDALYRLSHPAAFGLTRKPVQLITTTHSPYFLDLFRDHPEEVVISQKTGRAARFERLSERPDLPELLREGSLGDMWYSGILGGVPDES